MYIGICKEAGRIIQQEDALEYALMRCMTTDKEEFVKEFGQEIEEWFFSGNWIKEQERKYAGLEVMDLHDARVKRKKGKCYE